MGQINEKMDLLNHFSNNQEVLDYLAEYFHEYANTTFDKELFKLEKAKDRVSLLTLSHRIDAVVSSEGSMKFLLKSIDLTNVKLYGFIRWNNKKFWDSESSQDITFTNGTLKYMLKELN
ncbi:hypothetical protein [Lysinibacillus piscis]|uniref:Uncharacterized protein n=1 Tax=Lysinibacillus piscis TaxID=2518931 RepID=A0ABQ5NM10_9BACI|nr:hypothetical protein [Lysinibacillus sp. KH24]GLC89348.1 hypothetical protein LYSBPC_24750 [Lysinibacillus sp. KH24]